MTPTLFPRARAARALCHSPALNLSSGKITAALAGSALALAGASAALAQDYFGGQYGAESRGYYGSASSYTYGATGTAIGPAAGGGYGGGTYGGAAYGGGYGGGAGGATAQGANGAYTIDGLIELEGLQTKKRGDAILYGDVQMGYMPQGSAFGITFGFEGYTGDDSGDDLAVYAAGRMRMGAGELSFGIPRAAFDEFTESPALGGSRYLDITTGQLTSSFTRSYYLSEGKTPLGLRYDAQFGQARMAASVHRFEDDATAIDLAGGVNAGPVTLTAAAEHVDGEGPSGVNLVLGAQGHAGQFGGGLLYSALQRPGDIEGWTAWAEWRPQGPLAITGSVISAREDRRSSTLYGISADYTFWEGAYVQGGFLDGDDTRATYDVSLGWRF